MFNSFVIKGHFLFDLKPTVLFGCDKINKINQLDCLNYEFTGLSGIFTIFFEY